MVNQDEKLFYLSGLFSISFFLVLMFSALYYSYSRDRILNIRTKKNPGVEVILYEAPPKPKKVEKSRIAKPKPRPKIIPPKPKKRTQPKNETPKVTKKITPPPPPHQNPVKTAPSLDSLFSKIDTSRFKAKEEEIEKPKPLVSEETINRLKKKITKTKTPIDATRKDENISIENYKLQRTFKIAHTHPISLDYKELEITSSSIEDTESGMYDKIFSQIQSFLHNNWYPSSEVAGNSAYVRIVLSEDSIFKYYKIVTAGKNPEFNIELKEYLNTLIGKKMPVDLNTPLSFEVKFRAKE